MARPLRIGYKMQIRKIAGLSNQQKNAFSGDKAFGVKNPPGLSKKIINQLKKEMIKNSK